MFQSEAFSPYSPQNHVYCKCGEGNPLHIPLFTKIQMLTTNLQTVKDFFTEEEWDAIDSALADYQDYGEKETDLMNSIGDKMQTLFAPRYQDENRHPESGAN